MALLFDSLVLNVITFLTSVTLILYLYFTRKYKLWKNRGIPYIKPLPFVGNFKDVVLQKYGIGHYLKIVYDEHKDKPYVGVFAFHQPALVVHDLDLIKSVLVKDAQVFINHKFTVQEATDPLLHNNIFTLKGQKWRHMRTYLSPTFTSGKMKNMFYLVNKCAKELVEYVDKTHSPTVHVKETMARFTTDVIASCALGLDTGSLQSEDPKFRHMLRNVFNLSPLKAVASALAFFSPDLLKILRIKIIDDNVTDFVRNSVWETVEYRQKNGIIRKDFLDMMIELRKKMQQDPSSGINRDTDRMEDDFVAQAFIFVTAGFETSSSTMSHALYELALHPEMQHRLRAEITNVLAKHDQCVTYEGIQEMPYLDMVVCETLRKYPIVTFLDRDTNTDYKLPPPNEKVMDATLPAGAAVYIPVLGIHYDPKYYPEPDNFDPERFTEENKKSRPNFSYLPFGEGPRICIGMRFGIMQTKTGLIHILSNYEVSPAKDTPIPLTFDPKPFLLTSLGTLPLNFTKIST